MNASRLGTGELIALLGGAALAAGLFLPWYVTNPSNPNAAINGGRGTFSGWDVHTIIRWLLIAAAAAPLILLWVVLREHELSWPRGEMTAVVAIVAFGLVSYVGVIDRPGEPKGEISLKLGWFGALLGVILMAVGGAMRAGSSERPRKPPGVL
jgi:hypothetical protein